MEGNKSVSSSILGMGIIIDLIKLDDVISTNEMIKM